MSEDATRARWRLALGEASELELGPLGPDDLARDAALAWLYDREAELAQRDVRARGAPGEGRSALTVPEWLNEVHRLFPRETIERLERDAAVRYEIDEVVTNPEVLARVEPSLALLEAVLRTKHLMDQHVLALARALVARVVADLKEKLAREVRASFSGARDRRRPSRTKIARNFDGKRTIRENLAHYSLEERRLYVKAPRFFSRSVRHATRFQVVLLVDQSGSMASALIHAAVTAACLHALPSLRTHLCLFDTQVVDLTEHVADPVEVLFKVQLGGGTDIGRAIDYAAGLIEAPRRSIVVVLSDFFEGGDRDALVRRVKALVEQGTIVLGLAALDEEARPAYDRELAQKLADAGAHVAALTPGELARWIAEKVSP